MKVTLKSVKRSIFGLWRQGWLCLRVKDLWEDRPQPVTDCWPTLSLFCRKINYTAPYVYCILYCCTYLDFYFTVPIFCQINYIAPAYRLGILLTFDPPPPLQCISTPSICVFLFCICVFVYFSSCICVISDQKECRHWHALQFLWQIMGLPFDAPFIVDKKTIFIECTASPLFDLFCICVFVFAYLFLRTYI